MVVKHLIQYCVGATEWKLMAAVDLRRIHPSSISYSVQEEVESLAHIPTHMHENETKVAQ